MKSSASESDLKHYVLKFQLVFCSLLFLCRSPFDMKLYIHKAAFSLDAININSAKLLTLHRIVQQAANLRFDHCDLFSFLPFEGDSLSGLYRPTQSMSVYSPFGFGNHPRSSFYCNMLSNSRLIRLRKIRGSKQHGRSQHNFISLSTLGTCTREC